MKKRRRRGEVTCFYELWVTREQFDFSIFRILGSSSDENGFLLENEITDEETLRWISWLTSAFLGYNKVKSKKTFEFEFGFLCQSRAALPEEAIRQSSPPLFKIVALFENNTALHLCENRDKPHERYRLNACQEDTLKWYAKFQPWFMWEHTE